MSETIPVELTEQEWNVLVAAFVEQQFRQESLEVFNEALAGGSTVADAVYNAIRNEAVNNVLEVAVERERAAAELAIVAPSKMIWVTFQKEGIHLYPAAATDPKLKTGDWDDVSFLGVPHRHIFHFKVKIEVVHSDRDIEFIQFKRWLERLYSDGTLELNHKSCEMISDDLHAAIVAKYPNRKIVIEVSEDGENGSVAEYPVAEYPVAEYPVAEYPVAEYPVAEYPV